MRNHRPHSRPPFTNKYYPLHNTRLYRLRHNHDYGRNTNGRRHCPFRGQRTVTMRLCDVLHCRLRRISDGETGKRCNLVIFQGDLFNESPFVKDPFPPGSFSKPPDILPGPDAPPVTLLPIEYDDYASAGYREFCNPCAEGSCLRVCAFRSRSRRGDAAECYRRLGRASVESGG